MISRNFLTSQDIFTKEEQRDILEAFRSNPFVLETESRIPLANESNPFLSHMMLVNTLGLSIIVESFSEAYYYLQHNSSITRHVREKAEECKDAFLFIQGTGLEQVLYKYGCEYDANALRQTFYYLVDRRDLIGGIV